MADLYTVENLHLSLPDMTKKPLLGAAPRIEILKGISFTLPKGEILGVVGGSGSGKSTLGRAMVRLLEPTGGRVLFDGQDITHLDEPHLRPLRRRFQMIFQDPMSSLNPVFTVGDQLMEPLMKHMGLTRKQALARAEELLVEVGMPEPKRRLTVYPHEMSGGQQQRVMIAMALACEPKLLLADEPTTALDANLRLQMLQLLARLQQRTGMAVLLITHDLALVRHFAQKIAVMEKGHLVEQGDCAAVFARPQHAYTRKLLGSRPDRAGLAPAPPDGSPIVQVRQLLLQKMQSLLVLLIRRVLVANGTERKIPIEFE